MIVKKIVMQGVGPFFERTEMDLDPKVTIVTGANDVGKTSVLRSIELALSDRSSDDSFHNADQIQRSSDWKNDQLVYVEVHVALTAAVDLQSHSSAIHSGDTLTRRRLLAPGVAKATSQSHLRHGGGSDQRQLKLPAILTPGSDPAFVVGDIIDLKKPGPLEQALLDVGFERPFTYDSIADLKGNLYSKVIRDAQEILNRIIERVMPHPGTLKFDLMPVEGDRSRLAVFVRDRHSCSTPFGNRGVGVRKIITIVAELITVHRGAHHKLVIIDEPETSLHADAQHLLREFLYRLAEDGQTQVVYATHSPSMVNPMRAEQIRLFGRIGTGSTATSRLIKRPTEDNFLGLRTSLGISAADSLLFAPVTVVTEGETEVGCLPLVISRLEAFEALNGKNPRRLLGLCNFLDGMGDSFEYLCRLAKAHGAKVVLFLDGDKRTKIAQVRQDHPDVPIVFLPGQSEFEELVPAALYLRALSELSGVDFGDKAEEQITEWVLEKEFRKKKAFSKRVEGWFDDTHDVPYPSKRSIMQKAVGLAKKGEITAEPVLNLLSEIETLLLKTSFE